MTRRSRHAPLLSAALVLTAAAFLPAACLDQEAVFLGVGRFALVPDSVSRLAVTAIRPNSPDGMQCEADGSVHDLETGAVAGATADLFAEPMAETAELTGPAELTHGSAEGAVIDGIRPGGVLVFAEGFDDTGRAVARACAGPVVVARGRVTDVDLYFVEL